MKVGDYIEYDVGEDIIIVGEVITMGDRGEGSLTFIEAHAFHQVWGGSNGMRGEFINADVADPALRPVRSGWKHIVKEGMEHYRKDPGKWDRYRRRNPGNGDQR